jgi:hypothetical protein
MATMRRSAIDRRIDAAEAAVAMRFRDRAMDVLGDAILAASPEVNLAVEMRLRRLSAAPEADPSWCDDPVLIVFRAIADVAPEMVDSVAAELGIDLNPRTQA